MANPYPKDLGAALKASRGKLNILDGVGTSSEEFESAITTMERVAGNFITNIKNNLTTGNYQVTGDIANITAEVVNDSELNIVAPIQLLVLNYGIAGVYSNAKAPKSTFSYHEGRHIPLLPILGWVKFRGLEFRKPDRMTQITADNMTQEQKDIATAYAIKSSIYKEGRKPVDIFTSELDELEAALIEALGDKAITNVLSQLPLTISVPAAFDAEGQIPLTGVAIPGLLNSNR